MKVFKVFGVICLALFIWGCIDEIGLNVDTEVRTVVVDGFVTDSLGDFELSLSYSSVIGIGNDNILDPIGGATVILLDDMGGSYPYTSSEEELGIYRLSGFKALRDRSYFIDIVLSDGKHYQSQPAKVRSSSTIDDVSYVVEERSFRNNIGELITEERIAVNIATNISEAEERPFLRWRVEGEYQLQEGYPGALNLRRCYIKNNLDINDIKVVDGSEINGPQLFGQEIVETAYDFRFADQFCFHIYQFSISQDEFEYWNNIKEIIDISGGLFDPPPGTVIGNIINVDDVDDVAVGYFSVASVYFTREFVNSNELGIFVGAKCGFNRTVPFGCRNCTEVSNSTLTRPSYWEF
jgi:hypothetical protein